MHAEGPRGSHEGPLTIEVLAFRQQWEMSEFEAASPNVDSEICTYAYGCKRVSE